MFTYFKMYLSIYISIVKRLFTVNRIHYKTFCLHNICVYCVYLVCIYKYTHMNVYIKYIYI